MRGRPFRQKAGRCGSSAGLALDSSALTAIPAGGAEPLLQLGVLQSELVVQGLEGLTLGQQGFVLGEELLERGLHLLHFGLFAVAGGLGRHAVLKFSAKEEFI